MITDGQSNVGISPVLVAKEAFRNGIIVNTIGVVDEGRLTAHAEREVKNIAEAGGGLSRIISSKLLSSTVQMVTRQAMNVALQQAFQKEIKKKIGNRSLDDIHPYERGQIFETLDKMSEECTLRMVLLIDRSASMKKKLASIEMAIHELNVSLRSRLGKSLIEILFFPGNQGVIDIIEPWTNNINTITPSLLVNKLGGKTPTGPALKAAIHEFELQNTAWMRGSYV